MQGQQPFDGVLYLTDGYGPAPSTRPNCEFLWVISDGGYTEVLPFGPTVVSAHFLPPCSHSRGFSFLGNRRSSWSSGSLKSEASASILSCDRAGSRLGHML
jgi:hypothetical protein